MAQSGSYGFKGTPATSGNDISVSAQTNAVTDISGNGALFYKPTWDPTSSSIATSIDAVANKADAYYYVQFILTLTNSSSANDMNVYLSSGTSITSSGATVYAAHAARVAIFNYSTTTTTEVATTDVASKYLTDGTDETFKYVSSSAGGSVYSTATNGYINSTTLASTKMVTVANATAVTSTEPANKLTDPTFVTTVPHGDGTTDGTAYVGVTIWLEGESANCNNDAAKETLSVALHLTGF
jgi:hypothetical protein